MNDLIVLGRNIDRPGWLRFQPSAGNAGESCSAGSRMADNLNDLACRVYDFPWLRSHRLLFKRDASGTQCLTKTIPTRPEQYKRHMRCFGNMDAGNTGDVRKQLVKI